MKRNQLLQKDKLYSQKRKYLFLLIIMGLGLLFGIIFLFLISKEDKTILLNEINQFFTNIKDNKLDTTGALINSITSNLLSISLVWLLGISIIGIPFIIFFLFFKNFVLGFSIASILSNYGFKGILLSFSYIFPHQLIFLLIWLLLSFYALSFAIKLGKVLFLKKNINLRDNFLRYIKIGGICLAMSFIGTLIEVYITPHFINLFIF